MRELITSAQLLFSEGVQCRKTTATATRAGTILSLASIPFKTLTALFLFLSPYPVLVPGRAVVAVVAVEGTALPD